MAKRIEDLEVEALGEQRLRDAGERAVGSVSDFDSVAGADSAGIQCDDRVLVANAQLDKVGRACLDSPHLEPLVSQNSPTVSSKLFQQKGWAWMKPGEPSNIYSGPSALCHCR
jgi:hypothetical protein